jgi:hypothetical protein
MTGSHHLRENTTVVVWDLYPLNSCALQKEDGARRIFKRHNKVQIQTLITTATSSQPGQYPKAKRQTKQFKNMASRQTEMTAVQQQQWDELMIIIGMNAVSWTSKLEYAKVLLQQLDKFHSHTLAEHRFWIAHHGKSCYDEEKWLNWNTYHKDFTEKLWHWIDDEEDRIFFEEQRAEEGRERRRRAEADLTNRRSTRLLIKRLA